MQAPPSLVNKSISRFRQLVTHDSGQDSGATAAAQSATHAGQSQPGLCSRSRPLLITVLQPVYLRTTSACFCASAPLFATSETPSLHEPSRMPCSTIWVTRACCSSSCRPHIAAEMLASESISSMPAQDKVRSCSVAYCESATSKQ